MALSDEQTKRLIAQADALAQKEGSVFRALVKLTEDEVRKEYDALIRQMLEALEAVSDYQADMGHHRAAITAARAWLNENGGQHGAE